MNEVVLENYYTSLKDKLKTGKDKVTSQQFSQIRKNEYALIIKKFNNHSYKLTSYRTNLVNSRLIHTPTIRDKIVIKYLYDILKIKFSIHPNNRNEDINKLIKLLSEDISYTIYRTDIKKFYDNIPTKKLIHKILKSNLLTSQETHLLLSSLKGFKKGIPQGLSISSPLSEIFMENIDYQLRRLNNSQILYLRYVDDIIILFQGSLLSAEISQITNNISNILSNHGLQINSTKTHLIPNFPCGSDKSFDYLGYNFSYNYNEKKIKISISKNKLDKEKEKIQKCFQNYLSNKNLDLLHYRLEYLTKINYILTVKNDTSSQILKFGFVEVYKFVNSEEAFFTLDKFIKHCIIYYLKEEPNRFKQSLYKYSYLETFKTKRYNAYYRYTKDLYISRISNISTTIPLSVLQMKTLHELKKEYFRKINKIYQF